MIERRPVVVLAVLLSACGASHPEPLMGSTRSVEIDQCRQTALQQHPKMWGVLGVDIKVAADGRPSSIEPHLVRGDLSDEYRQCVVRALWGEHYRKNSEGAQVWFGMIYKIERPWPEGCPSPLRKEIGSRAPTRCENVSQCSAECGAHVAAACSRAAMAWTEGLGVAVNPTIASEFFIEECVWGDPDSCVNIAVRLQQGDGITVDDRCAVLLLKQACSAGSDVGCFHLRGRERTRSGDAATEVQRDVP